MSICSVDPAGWPTTYCILVPVRHKIEGDPVVQQMKTNERNVDLRHIREKVRTTLLLLSSDSGSQRKRLEKAYGNGLNSIFANGYSLDGLSPETQEMLVNLEDEMTSAQQIDGEGTIAATVQAMNDEDVDYMVGRVIAVCQGVTRDM